MNLLQILSEVRNPIKRFCCNLITNVQSFMVVPFWDVIEQYRSFYSHFYPVKIDFTADRRLTINKQLRVTDYLIEIFVIFLYGSVISFHLALTELFFRKDNGWYFHDMTLINLVLIVLIGFSGMTQIVLFHVTEQSAEDVVPGFNSMKQYINYLHKSMNCIKSNK